MLLAAVAFAMGDGYSSEQQLFTLQFSVVHVATYRTHMQN
jgi:hypothetical protein